MNKVTLLILILTTLLLAQTDQATGYYTKGVLVDGTNMPIESEGMVKLFRSRDRGYGTEELVNHLIYTGKKLKEMFPDTERMQVGDLSGKHGGKISGHNSHQNGLDVDIVFLRVNRQEQDLEYEKTFQEHFVHNGVISPNFDIERNWEMLKILTSNPLVHRIFVDVTIKKELCIYAAALEEHETYEHTLRSLRPWPHHADHLHLRIKCPEHSLNCRNQTDPPEGSGCDQI